jgi:hypothetical protein
MKKIHVCDIMFVVMCLALLALGLNVTRGLEWPKDLDHYRDIALTQTILDGHYGKDAYYLNEYVWYNPALSFLTAGAGVILDRPAPKIIARVALFFNILAVLAFYILLRVIFGSKIALIGTAAYLISNNIYPDWASSLFSFTPFPIIFSQAFLYITIGFFYWTIKKERGLTPYIITGSLLGITFLFNTTAAIICVGIIVLYFLQQVAVNAVEFKIHLKRLFSIGIPAFLISLIFIYPILMHYRFKIQNDFPLSWVWPQLKLDNLPRFLLNETLQVTNLIGLFGLLHLAQKNKDTRLEKIKNILLLWVGVILVIFVYSFIETVLRTSKVINLPSFAPVHRYFFFLKALSFIYFGYGAYTLWDIVIKKLESRSHFVSSFKNVLLNNHIKTKIVCCILFSGFLTASVLYVYSKDERLGLVKESFIRQTTTTDLIDSYKWIRQNTESDDVFLCIDKFSMRVVAPAGRKVIATHPFFSNPYVDYKKRANDRNMMLKYLESGDKAKFRILCREYSVKYIILDILFYRKKTHDTFNTLYKEVYRNSSVVILKLSISRFTFR